MKHVNAVLFYLADKYEDFSIRFPRTFAVVTTIAYLTLFTIALSSLGLSQERAPESFLGFDRGEYATSAREKTANLELVDSGRMTESGLPFLTFRGYVTPDGKKIEVLTLTFTNDEYPKLVGVSAILGRVSVEEAGRALFSMKESGAVMARDERSIWATKEYANATFRVMALDDGNGGIALATFLVWGEVR